MSLGNDIGADARGGADRLDQRRQRACPHARVAPVTVTGGAQSTVNVAWDQKNDDGRAVASDDFTLALGFDAAPASQQRQAVDVRVTLTVGP